VNPALRFFQSQEKDVIVPQKGCYVIVDCGSSSTKILIEKSPGAKDYLEDGDALARIDCVLDWAGLSASCSKKGKEGVNHKDIPTYKRLILDQIKTRKPAACEKVYIAMFATGGMRQNKPGVVKA